MRVRDDSQQVCRGLKKRIADEWKWDVSIDVPRFNRLSALIVIASVSYSCFSAALKAGFVFDDHKAILSNPYVVAESSRGETLWWEVFGADFWGKPIRSSHSHKSYRPIASLLMRWIVSIFGHESAYPFHIFNLILHSVNSGLLLLSIDVLVRDLTTSNSRSPSDAEKTSVSSWAMTQPVSRCAFLTALLFVVHPVHTEPVIGCVGIADLLCCMFLILSLLCFLKLKKSELYYGKFFAFLLAYIVFVLFSSLSKEQGLLTPALSVAVDLVTCIDHSDGSSTKRSSRNFFCKKNSCAEPAVVANEINFPSIRRLSETLIQQRRFCSSLDGLLCRTFWLGLFQVTLVSFRFALIGGTPGVFRSHDNPAAFMENFHLRVLNKMYIWLWNLRLLICPNLLCFDWSMGCIDLIRHLTDARILLLGAFVSITIMAVYFLIVKHKNTSSTSKRMFQFSVIFGAVSFFPASNLFFTVGFTIAERQLYIPSIAFCLLVVLAFDNWHQNLSSKRAKEGLKYLFFAVVLLYAVKTSQRCNDWSNEHQLFQSGLLVCPSNAKIWYNLAVLNRDNASLSLALYFHAEQLYPDYPELLNNLGNLLQKQQHTKLAAEKLAKAVKMEPDFATAWMNYGVALTGLEKYKEAQVAYNTALNIQPHCPDCYFNLGLLLKRLERIKESAKAFEICVAQNPFHVQGWIQYLNATHSNSRFYEAIKKVDEALKFLPRAHELIAFKAFLLKNETNFLEQSRDLYLEAISINPSEPIYYTNLGVVFHQLGDSENAVISYRRAIELDPTDKRSLRNLDILTNGKA